MADEPPVSHSPSPRVGSRFGPYLLKRMLGSGGFGEVYEAEDTAMHRVVALKLLSSSYSHNPAFRERLFREARTAGRLHDPHVVPIHGCGEIDGQLYIDMRLIDGTDLQSVLDRDGPLDPALSVAIVRQIGAALDAAHAERVIHRDVKPANILLGGNNFACLVDFGLANAATDTKLTSEGTTIGSFAYLAPERLTKGDVTPGADVYALACVLYECLTGTPPFAGRDEIPALVAAHLAAPIPRPSQQRPGIPVGFDEVIARGMAKNPAERYPSAGELAGGAQHVLNTNVSQHNWAPVQPPMTPPWAPSTRPPAPPLQRSQLPPRPKARRRNIIAVAAVAFVIAVAATAVVIAVNHRAAPHTSTPTTTSPRPTTATAPPANSAPPLNAMPLPLVGFGILAGVAVDKDGNVYVVDSTGPGVLKLAVGATGPSELPFGGLTSPSRVAVDMTGNVYVTDSSHSGATRVLKLAPGATNPTELSFGGLRPGGLAVDTAGNVYAAGQDRVLKLAVGATAPTVLPFGNGYFQSVTVDSAGTVYAADRGNVLKLTPGAAAPTQLPFAQLGSAQGIAVDTHGNVYVIDNAGLMGRLVRLAAGAGTSTELFAPENQEFGGLAVDPEGNIYLTENKRLLKVAAG